MPEKLPGDPAAGARLYQAKGCNACHIVRGQGSGYGPELTAIGSRRSAAYLRESLVRPAAAAPDNFLLVEAVDTAGRTHRGIRRNEDSFTIQIQDDARRFHSFRKSGLKDLRRLTGQSPMPASQLSPRELDDMVAYLASLRGAE